jgi:hypothetical protein
MDPIYKTLETIRGMTTSERHRVECMFLERDLNDHYFRMGIFSLPNVARGFYVKMELEEEFGMVKQLHNLYHEQFGGYSTRTSFIKHVFRLGLREAAASVKYLERDRE